MDKKSKVFICAAPEDQKIARRLYNDLNNSGITPWMESEDLRAGQNRQLMVRENIQNSGFFLVLLSSTSLSAKGDYHKQLNIALDILDEFPHDQIFVIPVHLDVCKPLDKRLQDRQAVNLFPSYNDGFKQILRAMKHQAENNVAASKDFTDEELISEDQGKKNQEKESNGSQKTVHHTGLIPAFSVLIILMTTMIGISYFAKDALFPILVIYSKNFGTFVIYTGFVGVSLISAVVMFGIMRSTGVFKKTGKQEKYEFGGAMSGFFVVLVFLIGSYSNYTSSATEIKITVNVRFVEHGKTMGPVSDALVAIAGRPGYKNSTDKDGNIIFILPEDQKMQDIELQITYKDQPTVYRKVSRSEFDKVITVDIPKLIETPKSVQVSGSEGKEVKITVNVRFVENGKPVGPAGDALVSIAGRPGHKNNTDKDGNIILTLPEDPKMQDIELQITYKDQPTVYRKVSRSELDKPIIVEIPKAIEISKSEEKEIKITVNVRFVENGKPVGPVSDASVSIAGRPGYKNNTDKDGNIILILPEDQKVRDIELQITYKDKPTVYRKVSRSELDKPVIVEIPKSDKPQTWENKKLSMEFVKINGGCYMMGCSDEKCHSYEKPEHEVCVDDFWIGKTEVTQQQWELVTAKNTSASKQDVNDTIKNISWDEVKEFIRKLNAEEGIRQSDKMYRLPREAEWEYVCRKGEGISNMSDHVWEWCEDVYNSEAYKQHERNNPIMLVSSEQPEQRVTRGGSLGTGDACTSRMGTSSNSKAEHIGFRLVRTKID